MFVPIIKPVINKNYQPKVYLYIWREREREDPIYIHYQKIGVCNTKLCATDILVDRVKTINIQGLLKPFSRGTIVEGQVVYRPANFWDKNGKKKMARHIKGFAWRIKYLSVRNDLLDNMVCRLSVLSVVNSPVMTCDKYPLRQPLFNVYLLLT